LNLKSKDLYYINKLQEKKITAIALEELTEHDGSFPFVSSLSEISGLSAIYIAAELMSKSNEGKGQLFGNISGVPPTEIVIFGSGTAAIWAAKTALNLGASVKIFDNSTSNLRKIQSELKYPIYTSTLQPKNMLKALRRCDVAVGAVECHHRTPVVVSEDMVSYMKRGSVIIDISIDRGGCFETSQLTSHQKPTFKKFDVIHYCVPNIPSRYPKTASVSMSNICTPILLDLAEKGGIDNALRLDQGLQNGVYLYQGVLTNSSIADQLGLTHTNINFLIF
jgi:alanine dehydrogenase